jgi:hypothetical protein
MATVTDTGITLVDAMDSSTVTNVPTGGGGASQNTDLFIQGSASYAKRLSNVTDTGFAADESTGQDLTGLHVGIWVFYVHYSSLTALKAILCSSTANYGRYNVFDNSGSFPYPTLGGWARLWVDADKTADASAGSGVDKTSVRYFGFQVSVPSVGSGSAANAFLDAIHKTNSSSGGLLLTGTSGVWDDFLAADERGGGTNGGHFGIVTSRSGVIYCQGRLTLGSSSSLVFDDSGFALVFPNQQACSDTFMGISISLAHASTAITWAKGSLTAPGTKKGDLIVTGTSGVFTASGMVFTGLRLITLTSACSITDSSYVGCGQITAAGAVLTGSAVSGYEGASDSAALVWDVATDPDGYLDGSKFTKGTAATHAIEFGTTSPTTMTLRNVDFSGYNAADGNTDSAIYVARTSGTVTINIVGGTTPSVKSAGATVNVVSGTVTATVTCKKADGTNIQNVRVLVYADTGGPFPSGVSVTITRSGTTATVSHTGHGLATNDKVMILGADQPEYNGVFAITYIDANSYSYTVSGTPATPATGTITATFVVLSGLTDVNGQITMSRVFPSNQDVVGRARKSTSSPLYKTSDIVGTVDSSAGWSTTVIMIPDE